MIISAFFDHLAPVILILTRLSGLFVFAPFFGSTAIQRQVKFALVLTLSVVVHFGFGIGSDYSQADEMELVYGVLREFAVGAGMGLYVTIIFTGIGYAGAIIAPQMGMAISQLMDPQTESIMPLLSTFMNVMAVVFLLSIDGHLLMVRAFYESYRLVPLAGFEFSGNFAVALVEGGGKLFVIALKLCSPVLAVIIFLNVGMAIMARVVPQVNVIVVGFIITISVGIFTLFLVLPLTAPYLKQIIAEALEGMMWILKTV